MRVYYNEIDPFAAAWLRELMKAGQIPDGEVDTRSIADVQPDDLRGFQQCHFFAGIGGWALALKLAGWGDRPVWTGSCPCQPFSSAGAQAGGHDPRDLWPTWFQLWRECRPDVVFGEQVDAAIGHGWLDRVCADVESEGYAVGACSLPAASVGAFHIRQRLWFVADTEGAGGRTDAGSVCGSAGQGIRSAQRQVERRAIGEAGRVVHCGAVDGLADADGQRRTGERLLLRPEEGGRHAGEVPQVTGRGAVGPLADDEAERCGQSDVGDTSSQGLSEQRSERSASRGQGTADARQAVVGAGPSTFWSACDWLPCADGKARPVEPGTFPLAHGVSARVGRLRGYGNAIVPQVAQVFIEAYLETVQEAKRTT